MSRADGIALIVHATTDRGLAQFEFVPPHNLSLRMDAWEDVHGIQVWVSGDEPDETWRLTCTAPELCVSHDSLTSMEQTVREAFCEFLSDVLVAKS